MMMEPTTPGWYPDPNLPRTHVRWWDGRYWATYPQPIAQPKLVQPKVKPQKVTDRGLSGTAHTLWLIATVCTFGAASLGWFTHWLIRQFFPRVTRTIR